MVETQRQFTAYDIQACLHDQVRAELFRTAIFNTVKRGDIVVDAGSGSGLLGLFAAQAGAARVYCLEINDDYVDVIQHNAAANRLSAIEAVRADATSCDLPERVDVIISEVISAGFFYEPQLQILNNLLRFLKPGGATIPLAMENSFELIDAQESMYGLVFARDSRYHALPGDRSLTGRATYLGTAFDAEHEVKIDETRSVRGLDEGTANALRVHYRIEMTRDVWAHEPTTFLMNPQTIFLAEPVAIEPGRDYRVRLAYEASGSPLHAQIEICGRPH